MKQCIGNDDAMLTADESEVVEILVQLSNLILESETRRRFSFAWGSKKRRSAIDVSSVTAPSHPGLRLSASSTPSPSPLHQATNAVGGVMGSSCDTQAPASVKAEVKSPATPLSFSPSESDEKPNFLKRRTLLIKKREEYLTIIHELTQRRELLQGEVENVKRYYDELKGLNLKLKARKRELDAGVKRENPNLEISLSLAHHNSVNVSSSAVVDHHQLQLQWPSSQHFLSPILNQASGNQTSGSVQYGYNQPTTSLPSSSALGVVNSNMVGPIGILDLNVSLEESFAVDSCQPLDRSTAHKNLSRAMAAQARQKRIQIYRVKNSIGISKPRYSYR